ncbi:MAG TPA: hypothetical protein VGG33_05205 [Polyangia bacterium]
MRRRLYQAQQPLTEVPQDAPDTDVALLVDLDLQLRSDIFVSDFFFYLDGEPLKTKSNRVTLKPGVHEVVLEATFRSRRGDPPEMLPLEVKDTFALPLAVAGRVDVRVVVLVSLIDNGGSGLPAGRIQHRTSVHVRPGALRANSPPACKISM